jgi:cytoskeleton protein RodZ
MLAQDSMMISIAGTEAEDRPAILAQIEAELYRSEIYRRAIDSLEATVSEGTSAQLCLKAVAREAIRLALREMKLQEAAETKPEPPKKEIEFPRRKATPEPISEVQRQESLKRLGAQIRAARQARSMSIAELHSKTLVPVHQLSAIEAGHGAHLPEDVYLRGFIRRIAKALNIDSAALLDLLPAVDPVKAVLPSWYHPQQKRSIGIGGMALSPVHLYLGYAAVLSGGMVWLSHQSTQPARTGAELNAPQVSPTKSETQSTAKVSSSMQVAAPERL